jgi:ubiquitin-conjugating enzyme E2 A
MTAIRRITKEITALCLEIQSEPIDNHRIISIHSKDDNILNLDVYFLGPKESPYEEIINNIHIQILPDYPNKPPNMKFINKIFHPNISYDGSICLDILKDKWSPVYTIRTIILSIISLLSDPNPDSPLNGEAAKLYKESLLTKENRRKYIKKILETI